MEDDEELQIPPHVMAAFRKSCECCIDCNQSIPCDGVMAGGLCDSLCDCDDDDFYLPD